MSTPHQVPDQVLKWLYNSLAGNYHDPNRTYTDVARTLEAHPSLAPRTDIYTFENGSQALLLQLHGTIPVQFRGTTYKYPVVIWVPHPYPHEAPIAFLKPTPEMAVRPGQHVSVEGRIYHPYLANWPSHWNVSSLGDLVTILRDVFAKEPPVMAKTRQQSSLEEANTPERLQQQPQPPLPVRPPKPGDPGPSSAARSGTPMSNGPPLPPKPGQSPAPNRPLGGSPAPGSTQWRGPGQGPPLPPLPGQQHHQRQPLPYEHTPQSPFTHSVGSGYQQGQALPPERGPVTPYTYQYPPGQTQALRLPAVQPGQSPGSQGAYPNQIVASHAQEVQAPAVLLQPVPDLMSDPLDVTLPSQDGTASQIPVPPVPPNPEKDALIQALSETLRAQIEQTVSHNVAAVPALEAQHVALQEAQQRMQLELYQLEELDKTLTSNEKILHDTMREADRVVESVSQREVPSVDEVLVAPTVVAEQLYNLVAEEQAVSDAMFLLTRALDKGKISGDVFIKQTRSLARDQFMKKALIKKISQGMGLTDT